MNILHFAEQVLNNERKTAAQQAAEAAATQAEKERLRPLYQTLATKRAQHTRLGELLVQLFNLEGAGQQAADKLKALKESRTERTQSVEALKKAEKLIQQTDTDIQAIINDTEKQQKFGDTPEKVMGSLSALNDEAKTHFEQYHTQKATLPKLQERAQEGVGSAKTAASKLRQELFGREKPDLTNAKGSIAPTPAPGSLRQLKQELIELLGPAVGKLSFWGKAGKAQERIEDLVHQKQGELKQEMDELHRQTPEYAEEQKKQAEREAELEILRQRYEGREDMVAKALAKQDGDILPKIKSLQTVHPADLGVAKEQGEDNEDHEQLVKTVVTEATQKAVVRAIAKKGVKVGEKSQSFTELDQAKSQLEFLDRRRAALQEATTAVSAAEQSYTTLTNKWVPWLSDSQTASAIDSQLKDWWKIGQVHEKSRPGMLLALIWKDNPIIKTFDPNYHYTTQYNNPFLGELQKQLKELTTDIEQINEKDKKWNGQRRVHNPKRLAFVAREFTRMCEYLQTVDLEKFSLEEVEKYAKTAPHGLEEITKQDEYVYIERGLSRLQGHYSIGNARQAVEKDIATITANQTKASQLVAAKVEWDWAIQQEALHQQNCKREDIDLNRIATKKSSMEQHAAQAIYLLNDLQRARGALQAHKDAPVFLGYKSDEHRYFVANSQPAMDRERLTNEIDNTIKALKLNDSERYEFDQNLSQKTLDEHTQSRRPLIVGTEAWDRKKARLEELVKAKKNVDAKYAEREKLQATAGTIKRALNSYLEQIHNLLVDVETGKKATIESVFDELEKSLQQTKGQQLPEDKKQAYDKFQGLQKNVEVLSKAYDTLSQKLEI